MSVTYHRVTLLVPREEGQHVPRKWAWEEVIDSSAPVLVVHDDHSDAEIPFSELPESLRDWLAVDEEMR